MTTDKADYATVRRDRDKAWRDLAELGVQTRQEKEQNRRLSREVRELTEQIDQITTWAISARRNQSPMAGPPGLFLCQVCNLLGVSRFLLLDAKAKAEETQRRV